MINFQNPSILVYGRGAYYKASNSQKEKKQKKAPNKNNYF